MNATITYQLNESGRRASLIAGGDGCREQSVVGEINAADVNLFSVTVDGRLKCKLDRGAKVHRAIGWTGLAIIEFSAPMDFGVALDYLRASELESKEAAISAFMFDESKVPGYGRERWGGENGSETASLILRTDNGEVELPAEHAATIEGRRRYLARRESLKAEQAAREAEQAAREAEQAAREAEQAGQIAAWVAAYGSADQVERFAARLLPRDEVVQALKSDAFASGASLGLYKPIQREEVSHDGDCDCDADWELKCEAVAAVTATTEEWARRKQVAAAFPDALEVTIRRHTCTCPDDVCGRSVERAGVLVKLQVGAFTFNQEYGIW